MTADEIESLFTRADGTFLFARWARPIVPVVFGADDKTLSIFKGALEAVVSLAGHKMAETDPELGSNLMFFFFREWDELLDLDGLDRMLPELDATVARLKAQDAHQYRLFRFEQSGAIKAGFVFLRVSGDLAKMAAEDLALSEAVQVILLWGEGAFAARSPLARLPEGQVVLRPDVAGVIRAAYDPVMPVAEIDAAAVSLRLAARLGG
ncbi:hypothetical protein [Rhodalgimonas zhirmunskyi]|uniref:Uncharacterized protein n=1 Tax=Rhodalgimonas zhirmunskyi TaxID=2964767 RepID=A0AAJ1X517_9RHOB|nr:hypothetical protein [Rhodoalgimonas zhirmunskyi]MDQ2093709.1 hypothetical protein [Rhodoalgimonas zhirmunskyi]